MAGKEINSGVLDARNDEPISAAQTAENNKTVDGGTLDEVTVSAPTVTDKVPFYYDRDLMRTLMSVSLHANSVLGEDGKWKEPTELTDDEGYMEKYLIKAPLQEDYIVNMRNTWTEFGDDAIGGFFNTLKPYAPYLGKLAQMARDMNDTEKDMKILNDPDINTNFGTFVDKVTDRIANIADKGADILNRSLVSQGARFSYYSGSGASFSNLAMKFTIFSGWRVNYYTGKTEWKTVNDQLSPLYPYIMGKYTGGVIDEESGNIEGTDIDTGIKGEAAAKINEFLSWQLPPAGYKPDVKHVDNIQFGTLKLKFGAFYSLPSLVCTNAQFNFSKQMVKQWDGSRNVLSPLYCDIVLNFQPATKYSDDSMRRFVSGESMKNEMKTVKKGLTQNLNDQKQRLTNYLQGKDAE